MSHALDLLPAIRQRFPDPKDPIEALVQMSGQLNEVLASLLAVQHHLTTPATIAALQLPMSPAILNEMINAVGLSGVAIAGVDMFSVVVPAGATVTGTVPVPAGKVTVSTAPLKVTASYYNLLVTMRVTIDGQEMTSTDYPYSMVGEDKIDFGQYYYAYRNLVVSITNNTATNTVVTFRSEGLAMDRAFFQDFYLPIIRYGYGRMKELAMTVNGGKMLP